MRGGGWARIRCCIRRALRPGYRCARLTGPARYGAEPSGTVTRASSHYFGGLSERPAASQIEIRASWTPGEGAGGVPDAATHLMSWCDLLAQVAGLPPAAPGDASVVTLPQRRGPQAR
ncbi:hypothetical protein SHIRM173S_03337 [Streptomyces hirsutus]